MPRIVETHDKSPRTILSATRSMISLQLAHPAFTETYVCRHEGLAVKHISLSPSCRQEDVSWRDDFLFRVYSLCTLFNARVCVSVETCECARRDTDTYKTLSLAMPSDDTPCERSVILFIISAVETWEWRPMRRGDTSIWAIHEKQKFTIRW